MTENRAKGCVRSRKNNIHQKLLVEFRRFIQLLKAHEIVFDPERRVVFRDECFDFFHRCLSHIGIEVKLGNVAFLATHTKVIEVARENNGAGFGKVEEQYLMTGRVAGRRDDSNAAVSKYVVIAIDDEMFGVLELVI